MTLPAEFKIKRGAAAGIPTLADGEPGWTTDTHVLYIGQGGVNYAINTGTPYTSENAQDDVAGMIIDTDTIDTTYTDGTPELKFDVRTQLSITSDASGIKLSGDSASPGNSYYYGTDSGGTKGYFALPTYQPLDAMLTSLAALTDPGADRILFWDDSDGNLGWLEAGSGISISGTTISVSASGVDHGGLTGLGDDDHTQYVLLAGRSGGQNLHGGTGSADDLILESTSHGTKGYIRCVDAVHIENRLLLNEATASLTGSVNNWAPTGLTSRSRVEITADGNYNVTGIDSSGHAIGGLLLLVNADATNTITLKDESASSLAANRFSLSADYVLQPGAAVALLYSTELTRWVSLSGDGATSYTDEEAQDAVGGILADTDTVNATYTDGTPEIKFDVRTQLSITSDASGIKLSGDSASPGNSYYYGTDSGGTKGYFALPTYQAQDAFLDDIAALTDPGADRILFWDDSVGDIGWLEAGSGLSISGTTISATALSDGDKGDITVSASGATWTIDENAVSYSKIQPVNANRLLGRPDTGGGTVMEIELNATLGFFSSAIGIAANAVTGEYFRQSAAYSVVGNATGSTADVTDISATNGSGMGILTFSDTTNEVSFFQSTTAGFVKSNGSALSVGTISLSDLPTLTVTEIPALNGFTDADPALADIVPIYDSSASGNRDAVLSYLLGLLAPVPGGRLTLTSGTPITTSDVTGATTVYYTPYNHDRIVLWDGTRWVAHQFAESSIALGTITSGLPYDLFGYLSAGTFTLEKLAWTNTTTRATGVTYQDGRPCKSGDKTRLYLGSFHSTSTTQTEDSEQYRLLFNHYNRVPRKLRKTDSTASWTYNTAAYRAANNSTANRVGILHGQPSLVYIHVSAMTENSGGGAFLPGIGEDSTTTQGADQYTNANHNAAGSRHVGWATLHKSPAVGYHYYQWLEYAVTAGTITWHSNSTMGITGWTMQ